MPDDPGTRTEEVPSTPAGDSRQYGWFVHARALRLVVRNLWVYLGFVVANALVQALLVWAVPVGEASLPVAVLGTALSALWLFAMVSLTARLTLLTLDNDGSVPPGALTDAVRRLPAGVLWVAVTAAVTIAAGFVLPWLGLLVAFLLAFAPFAAVADGDRNPLRTSLMVVRHRPGRYLTVVALEVTLLALGTLFTLLSAVLVAPPLAQFLNLLAYGLAFGWFLAALGVLFRSTPAGSTAAPSEAHASL